MFLIQLSVAEQEVARAGCVAGGLSFLPYGNIGSLQIMWNSCTREGICAGFHLLALILGEHSLVHQVPISVGFGLRIFLLRGIANQVGLGLAELRLVFSQLSLGLVDLRLERARIDLHQRVALFDSLPLLIRDLEQLGIDSGANGDGIQGGHGAQTIYVHGHVSTPGSHRDDRNRATFRGRLAIFALLVLRLACCGTQKPQVTAAGRHRQQHQPHPPAIPAFFTGSMDRGIRGQIRHREPGYAEKAILGLTSYVTGRSIRDGAWPDLRRRRAGKNCSAMLVKWVVTDGNHFAMRDHPDLVAAFSIRKSQAFHALNHPQLHT